MQGPGQGHVVYMVQNPSNVEQHGGSGSESGHLQTSRTTSVNLFYPKKIGLATRNLLLSEKCNVGAFLNWWNSTNISNDFWLEGPEALVRVHVIPRKALFDPSAWRTTELEHKQALLDSLGSIRSTCAISCKTQRELTAA